MEPVEILEETNEDHFESTTNGYLLPLSSNLNDKVTLFNVIGFFTEQKSSFCRGYYPMQNVSTFFGRKEEMMAFVLLHSGTLLIYATSDSGRAIDLSKIDLLETRLVNFNESECTVRICWQDEEVLFKLTDSLVKWRRGLMNACSRSFPLSAGVHDSYWENLSVIKTVPKDALTSPPSATTPERNVSRKSWGFRSLRVTRTVTKTLPIIKRNEKRRHSFKRMSDLFSRKTPLLDTPILKKWKGHSRLSDEMTTPVAPPKPERGWLRPSFSLKRSRLFSPSSPRQVTELEDSITEE